MARIFATGFELQSTATGMEFGTSLNGSPAVDTTNKHGGDASMRFNNTGAAENMIHLWRSSQGVAYLRTYFYIYSAPNSDRAFVTLMESANQKISVRMRSGANARKLQLYNEEDAAQIGSDSSALSANTWYRLEIKIDDTTLSSTSVEARLYDASDEGTLAWNPSGTANLAASPNRFRIGVAGSDSAFDCSFDDCAINDSSGSFQNSWCGQGSMVILRPNGNSTSQWTGSDGNQTDNYLLVDETPPNDATDYVESNTNNQVDEYTLSDTPSAVTSGSVINWVGVGVRFAISNTTGGDPDFVVGLKSGSDFDESGNLSGAGATTYNTNSVTSPGSYAATALGNNSNYEVPNTSTAWTKTTLDSALVRIRESATDTHFQRVSAVWVYVDYSPGGNAFTQDVSGGITPSGAIIKDGRKVLAGGNTPAGTVSKSTAKTFSGGMTPSGSLFKSTAKILSGALSSIVGTLSTNRGYTRSFDGDITPTGAITKQGNKTLDGTVTSSGALTKQGNKTLDGTLTSSGTLTKQAQKLLSGAITSIVGTLEATKTALISLGGTLSPTGNITKQTNKTLDGGNTPSGSLSKNTSKTFSGALTPSGTIAKTAQKLFAGTLTTAGTITKQVNKFLSGVLTFAGDLAAELQSGATQFYVDVSGTLTSSGTVIKNTTKSFAGTLSSAGTAIKQTTKTFAGTLTSSGSVIASSVFLKVLDGVLSTAGTLTRQTNKTLSGVVTQAGTVSKETRKLVQGILPASGTVVKSISKFLSGVLNWIGSLIPNSGIGPPFVDTVHLRGSLISSVTLTGSTFESDTLEGSSDITTYLEGNMKG